MILLAFLQVPSLVNRKQWAELAGYGLVWLLATVYVLLAAGEAPLPHLVDLFINGKAAKLLSRLLGLGA